MKWQITGLDIKALEPLGFVQTCFLMASMPASPSNKHRVTDSFRLAEALGCPTPPPIGT